MHERRPGIPWLTSAVVTTVLAVSTIGGNSGNALQMQRQGPGPMEPLPRQRPVVVERRLDTHPPDAVRGTVARPLAEGLTLTLWATDPLLHDPIAIDLDGQGRLYVSQTTRRRSPDLDIKLHRDWVLPMLGFETVADRRRFLRQELAPERSGANEWLADLNQDGLRDWRDLTVNRERVSRLDDVDGDGVADRATVLFDGFHDEVSDVAGGLLVDGNNLYVAVSPDLWRLRDDNGDGLPDSRQAIATGFHVHIGFGGHGMSGIRRGPDGRLYWSIGDVSLNVVDGTGQRHASRGQGAIVRANPDGSDFEVFATGLRNAHEFAFDEHGNLLTVDNDGDHAGELERIVYVTNGQDSGWRINWQLGKYTDPDNNAYRVWIDEGMFRPRFEGQAAWFTPPVASYDGGPAGLTYNPGTALSDRWRGHLFVADFSGSSATSRIHAFQMIEQGAGFLATPRTQVLGGIVTTGLQFGPDGALYVADWITGWETKNQGRIWRLDVRPEDAHQARDETRALLASGVAGRPTEELRSLLSHADMRVRLEAQFALVDRSDLATLRAAALGGPGLAALHGIWGIAQLARTEARHADLLVPLLESPDAEVRAQAAKMLGDVRHGPAAGALMARLQDDAPRVRFFATEALGRLAHRPAVPAILAMLEANNDADVYLRHAGTLALARIGDVEAVAALAGHPSRALRIAGVVVLRRLKRPEVARFLGDTDLFVVTEAARAINDDGGIPAALPALAEMLDGWRRGSEPLMRRIINANLRVGTPAAAARVAAFAQSPDADEAMRVEALAVLGVWPRPSVLDRVDGWFLGPRDRDAAEVRRVVEPLIEPLLATGSPAVRASLLSTAVRLRIDVPSSAVPALTER